MAKKIFKYILLAIIGVGLAIAYSFLVNQCINLETIIVFIVLFAYIVFFIKFLSKLFK